MTLFILTFIVINFYILLNIWEKVNNNQPNKWFLKNIKIDPITYWLVILPFNFNIKLSMKIQCRTIIMNNSLQHFSKLGSGRKY